MQHDRNYRISEANGNGLAFFTAKSLSDAIVRYRTEFYPGREPSRFAVWHNGEWSVL